MCLRGAGRRHFTWTRVAGIGWSRDLRRRVIGYRNMLRRRRRVTGSISRRIDDVGRTYREEVASRDTGAGNCYRAIIMCHRSPQFIIQNCSAGSRIRSRANAYISWRGDGRWCAVAGTRRMDVDPLGTACGPSY